MAKSKRQLPKWFEQYVPDEVSQSTIFKFTIQIGDQKIKVDIRADLDIDQTIIQDQLEDVPSEFAYWAALYSEMKLQVGILERKIKSKRGILIDKLVKDAANADIRITDKQVQSIIEKDKDLNEMEAKLLIAQKHCGKLYFMIEALKMKSDSLRSLAGFARIEAQQGH